MAHLTEDVTQLRDSLQAAEQRAEAAELRIKQLEAFHDFVLGPRCTDGLCANYDGEHPHHENAMVLAHAAGQEKLLPQLRIIEQRMTALEASKKQLQYLGKLALESLQGLPAGRTPIEAIRFLELLKAQS